MMKTADREEWRTLHERLRGIAKRRAALDAEEARCLREARDMKLWRHLGYAHMNEYLERELGYAPQVGIERLRIAHALATLPRIEARLTDGGLPYSAVRELTCIATADTEQDWLDKVRGKTLREIEAMVSGRKRGDRSDDPKDPNLALRVLRLELSFPAFALFRQAQSAMADEHGGHLDDSALVEVLSRRALEGTGGTDRPAYQIALTLCEWCGRGWQNGAGCEVDIGSEVVERARCDAELLGSLDSDEPERLRTTVTPRVRRQVFARDHHRCTVPGCRSSRNLDLHHIEFQSNGGGHEMSNLTILCSGHHQSLHDGLLTIRGTAPHTLEFTWNSDSARPSIQVDASPSAAPPATGIVQSNIAATAPSSNANRPSSSDRYSSIEGKPQSSCADCPPLEGARANIDATPRSSYADPDANMDASNPRDAIVHDNWRKRRPLARQAIHQAVPHRTGHEAVVDRTSPALIDEDVHTALVTAGYQTREARAAVKNARPQVGAAATLEELLREALRQCTMATTRASPAIPRSY